MVLHILIISPPPFFYLSFNPLSHYQICILFQPKINTEITTTQVALNYIVAKGGVPLAEVNSPKQAQEVIGCLGWTLTDDEVSLLESASDLCS